MPERDAEVNPANMGGTEKTSFYSVEGRDIKGRIEALAPEEDWRPVFEEALIFAEGLEEGPDLYDLDNPETLSDLFARFTSKEGAMIRPKEPAEETWRLMGEKTASRIRELKRELKQNPSPERVREIGGEIGKLSALKLHVKARQLIDTAYLQRMETCESEDEQAKLLGRTPRLELAAKPDRTHWRAFFQGDFGQKTDRVLRRIVAMGMSDPEVDEIRAARIGEGLSEELFAGEFGRPRFPKQGREVVGDKIYAQGFRSDEVFQVWLKDLVSHAEGRMDVVWAAWRLAELWELTSEFGVKVNREKEDTYAIGNPPVVSGLMGSLRAFEENRLSEFGLNAQGERVKPFKYVGKTGLPFSIGKIGSLMHSYLHSASITSGRGGDVSLWSLWQEKSVGFHDSRFPWLLTEAQRQGIDIEDFAPGSFGFWMLQRNRAAGVAKDILSIPALRDLAGEDFFSSKVRNWAKTFGNKFSNAPPDQNPAALWMAGILCYYHPGKIKSKLSPEEVYRATLFNDRFDKGSYRSPELKGTSVSGVLRNAARDGFLKREDVYWLRDKFNVSTSGVFDEE